MRWCREAPVGTACGGGLVTVYEVDVPLMQPPLARWAGPKSKPCEPLNANTTYHRYERASRVRTVREAVSFRAKQARIPAARHLTVQLHYAPGDNRRRDADNLWPTLKAACDALARGPRRDWVGLDLVPDDTPEYMTKLAPVIHPGPGKRRLWIEIEVDPLSTKSLLEQVAVFVVANQVPSEAMVRSKLGTGFAGTALMFQQLEKLGVVSRSNGYGLREVLVPYTKVDSVLARVREFEAVNTDAK